MSDATRRPDVRAIDAVVRMLDTPMHTTIKATERLALLLIAHRMFGVPAVEGRAWPSVARLSREMGMSPATAKRAIRALKRAGLLEVEPGGSTPKLIKGRPVRSSIYRLGPEALRFIRASFPDVKNGDASLRLVSGE